LWVIVFIKVNTLYSKELFMPDFHPDRPKNPKCPPNEAQFASGRVWRGVRELPLSEDHFKSHAELKLHNSNPEDCEHWGLSVWVSEDAVFHARKLFKFMRRWYIAVGVVDANDGKILPTPNAQQPDHHTFWKFHKHEVAGKFRIVMEPG
jgi:hypothetical protein